MALTRALGLTTLADPRYEADDLIGSSVHRLREHGLRSVIVSADKDLSQLLGSRDEQWDYARHQRWSSEERRVGKEWVRTCRSRWSPLHNNKITPIATFSLRDKDSSTTNIYNS